jgi:aminoglycoside phosphotransferase (APT) family kinase protein
MQCLAAEAWKLRRPDLDQPRSIMVLQADRKAAICRLEGAGPSEGSVIAKFSSTVASAVELTVYEEILTRLPISAPQYYGTFQEPGDEHCWLFIEDVGGLEWSDEIEEHRIIAARWLADLHRSSTWVAACRLLPDGGPRRYLDRLRSIVMALRARLAAGVTRDEAEVLKSTMDSCDVLEQHWSLIEQHCEGMPCTLTHGDIAKENARVRRTEEGASFLLFDWEKAGWGVPAADLAAVDAATYLDAINGFWPHLTAGKIERVQACGAIFRTLSHNLGLKPAKRLAGYQLRLLEQIRAVACEAVS